MNKKILNIFILILIPYFYLFPHTFLFIEMGNDFEILYYSYKKYIFEFIKVGHFPLWSPSEGLGYSLIFNPFAQYFYPISWFLYSIAFTLGDLSKHTYFLYTVFGLSIYNVGQYFWLRKLNIDKKYCFIATLITCFSLKLNEILRFPNAVHSFAWFPWILYAITLTINKTKVIKSSLLIFIFTILILTAGYPYYILYGFILFSFYFLFISIIPVKQIIVKKKNNQNFIKSFLNNFIPALLAFLLIFPWFFKINELMEITRDRNLIDINFSSILSSNLIDQLGSWILPPVSYAESCYYFGAIVTTSLVLYFIDFSLDHKKNKKEKYFTLFIFFFFIFLYQISSAKESLVFNFFWDKIEFIKNFRAFSRINILFIPLFSILICFFLKRFFEKKIIKKSLIILFFFISIIILLQFFLLEILNYKNGYWEIWQEKRLIEASIQFKGISLLFTLYNNYIYSIFFILSFLFFFYIFYKNNKKFFFLIILLLVFSELFLLSNIQWAIPYKYYDSNGYNRFSNTPLEDLRKAFDEPRIITEVKGNTYFRSLRNFNINYFDNFGIDQHTRLVDQYYFRNGKIRENIDDNTIKKINYFWSLNNNIEKVFFSKSIEYLLIEKFVEDVLISKYNYEPLITIDKKKYNGDQIVIYINIKTDGYITFMDNWSPGWKVTVNNQQKVIEKTLGVYKAVKVNSGENTVKFKYEPW
jgi:hypothetical protein